MFDLVKDNGCVLSPQKKARFPHKQKLQKSPILKHT
jgi:hypothetical protein